MIGCLGWGRLSNFWEGKGRRNYLFYNMENCLYKKSFIAVDISLRPSNSFIYPSNPTRTPHNIQIKYPYNARSDWLGQRVLFIREQMQRVVDYLWLSNFCLSILTNSTKVKLPLWLRQARRRRAMLCNKCCCHRCCSKLWLIGDHCFCFTNLQASLSIHEKIAFLV